MKTKPRGILEILNSGSTVTIDGMKAICASKDIFELAAVWMYGEILKSDAKIQTKAHPKNLTAVTEAADDFNKGKFICGLVSVRIAKLKKTSAFNQLVYVFNTNKDLIE